MPEFKVIKGGGRRPPDRDTPLAIQAFHYMTVELLRAIVRGYDREARVGRHLEEFLRHGESSPIGPDGIVDAAIRQLHDCIASSEDEHARSHEIEQIVLASLSVAAETCCRDGAAQGRTGQKKAIS